MLTTLTVTVCCVLTAVAGFRPPPDDPASNQLFAYKNAQKKRGNIVTGYGVPVDSVKTCLTAGGNGPLLTEDIIFFERLAHFARERIPERTVHAKGAGAMGYFEVTHDVSNLTKACLFSSVGKITNVAARFSTATGERGTPDTARDLRGFAVKFYTECGIYDLMTLATPTFFIRDPMLFPTLIHSQKKNPVTNTKDWNMFWDFMSLVPQTLLQVMYIYSDMGIPDGYRYMDGFGGNAYKLVNSKGEVVYAKFILKAALGTRYLTSAVALNLSATDPEYSTRDLYNAISRGQYPTWTLKVQVLTQEQVDKLDFNPFDITKVWSEDRFPPQEVGKLVLNRNPINYFNEVEQIGFNPGHLVPGIEPSVDRVLQGRMFIYGDAQRYRVGPNFEEMPVNKPTITITNYERDGPQSYLQQGGAPNYYPNSFNGPQEVPSAAQTPYVVQGSAARNSTFDDDNFTQPALLWRSMAADEKERMIHNICMDLSQAAVFIQAQTVQAFNKVDPVLGYKLLTALQNPTC